jgi:hypothetical protein
MCFSQPTQTTPAAAQAPSPAPPPPQQSPRAPEVDPNTRNARENASTQRHGTAIFRNDLTIPTASPVGSGLNIPT